MNFLFHMDPLEGVDAKKDTSFIFMVGAVRAGHTCWFVPRGGISLNGARVEFHATGVTPDAKAGNTPFDIGETRDLTQDEVDAVFVRTEPPFDAAYLMDTWLLDRLPGRIPVINSPRGLRTVNEKVWASRFTEIVPATLVTRRRELYERFLEEHRRVIVKPTDAYGGRGVFLVERGDSNAPVVFQTLTGDGAKEVICQEFVERAFEGDKRIVLLDGEPLGAVLRVHREGEHRNNLFAGGTVTRATVDEADCRIVETIRPHLRELGLHFVGIDVIGGKLIEVNVTSPTCVQEINRFDGVKLEERVIDYVEGLVEKARRGAND